MRARVYIDGFNLYYGALKGRPYRWLNLEAMATQLLPPGASLEAVRYFTARVKPRNGSDASVRRQDVYLRALRTLDPKVSQHFGQFTTHPTRLPLANPVAGGSATVEVLKTEEKGSDVNLATYLLVDGYESLYDVAIVVTNDSDLAEPIGVVSTRLNRSVFVYAPVLNGRNGRPRRVSKELAALKGVQTRELREHVLRTSMFPDAINTATGAVTRPLDWK